MTEFSLQRSYDVAFCKGGIIPQASWQIICAVHGQKEGSLSVCGYPAFHFRLSSERWVTYICRSGENQAQEVWWHKGAFQMSTLSGNVPITMKKICAETSLPQSPSSDKANCLTVILILWLQFLEQACRLGLHWRSEKSSMTQTGYQHFQMKSAMAAYIFSQDSIPLMWSTSKIETCCTKTQ